MDLAITSLGMITSVGLDAVTACAAIRAGITTAGTIEDFEQLDEDSQEPAPVRGHPIRGFTEGFVFVGGWRRMAMAALADLIRQGELPDARSFWSSTGLVAVTPPLDDERFAEDMSVAKEPGALLEAYLGDLSDVPVPRQNVELVSFGHAGTAAALRLAQQRLSAGFERIIVLGADAYTDPYTLDWLAANRRLKVDRNPCGLAPGEAAACFLVERESAASRRRATVLAVIDAASFAREPYHLFQDQGRNTGAALAAVVGETLDRASPGTSFAGDLILDLNGETWRAVEWAHAKTRLGVRLGDATRLVLPCGSLGDVGAASGAVGVCLAARSFARGYASGPRALVVSSSEQGYVGALSVRAARPGR